MVRYSYQVIIRWSKEDQAFIASAPDFSGCVADGHTPLEAADAIKITIRQWIETAKRLGRPIPKPKNIKTDEPPPSAT
jgi:predicted RNase H-like HicB family nuclease